jgi:hypothetical protein
LRVGKRFATGGIAAHDSARNPGTAAMDSRMAADRRAGVADPVPLVRWGVPLLAIVLAALLAFWVSAPPAPLPVDADAAAFSAGRAMADVRAIASVPHPTGSAANARARDYLVGRLRALGFGVRLVATPLVGKPLDRLAQWRGGPADGVAAISIVAVRPGSDSGQPAVMVMAHYDSVWASPGAADDAVGVAAALEIARAMPRAAQKRDLVLLLTDGEELGLVGARAFFAPAPTGDALAGRIGAVINLESRGGGGRAAMFETGPNNGAMIDLLAASMADPNANSLAVKIYELLPNSTDFTPPKKRGIAGYNFAFIGDARLYHSPLATPDALDKGALQHLGAQALDLTRALLVAPALPAPAPDKVFSDVLGLFVIAYPPVIGWLVVAAIAGLALLALRQAPPRRLAAVGRGALDGVFGMIAAGVLLYGGNLLSGADQEGNYYDRLAALPRLEAQALLLFSAGLLVALGIGGARRGVWSAWTGLFLVNWLMVVAVQAVLPAAGPVLAWPLLVGAGAMALAALADATLVSLAARLLLAAAAVFGLATMGVLGHYVLLGIGPGLPSAIAVFAPMALLLLWPLLPPLRHRTALLGALVLVLVAGAVALSVRLDPLAPSVPPYSDK